MSASETEARCLNCGTDLGTFYETSGTRFESEGNYGSGVFDPMTAWTGAPREVLLIVICDSCMTLTPSGRIVLQKSERPRPTGSTVTPWVAPGSPS